MIFLFVFRLILSTRIFVGFMYFPDEKINVTGIVNVHENTFISKIS